MDAGLEKEARNRDWLRRRRAAEALAGQASPEALSLLLRLIRDWHAGVRVAAAEALGGILDARSAVALCGALGDRSIPVRLRAEEAVVRLGSLALEPLCSTLKDGNV